MATNAVSTRSRALGMHLVLVLSVCLLASQLLVAKPAPPTPVPAKETAVADTATALAAGTDEPEHHHAIAGPAKATVQ